MQEQELREKKVQQGLKQLEEQRKMTLNYKKQLDEQRLKERILMIVNHHTNSNTECAVRASAAH